METFFALLALCAGISPVTGEFLAQRPVTRSSDAFSLSCAWIEDWINNRVDGDLKRHRARYDVIVMELTNSWYWYGNIPSVMDEFDTRGVGCPGSLSGHIGNVVIY